MSMYNAIFGNNPFAWFHLVAIETTMESVPRFRDCYLRRCDDGFTRIMVLTRTGDQEYDEQNKLMEELPGFASTRALSVDSTYRVFLYDLPFVDYEERIKPIIEKAVDENNKREEYDRRGGWDSIYGPDPDERWEQFFADCDNGVENDATRRAKAVGGDIFEQLGLL